MREPNASSRARAGQKSFELENQERFRESHDATTG